MPAKIGGRQSPGPFEHGRLQTSSEIMGGSPVLAGKLVPVQTRLDYVEVGDSVDDFLIGFSSVTRERVVALLDRAATLGATKQLKVLLDECVEGETELVVEEEY